MNSLEQFTFGLTDYIVFAIMLTISAGVGIYFGFFSKEHNTTDEYLVGSRRLKIIPVAISIIASQLSAISMLSVPAETYSYGISYIILELSLMICIPAVCYVIIPVFYDNNLSNCYEYLQLRFNKLTRQLITATFVLNSMLILPVVIFVPSLAFSQVSGINVHLINSVVCSICVFYTMLGGMRAVVWTDTIRIGFLLLFVILVGILGTIKIGGLSQVLEKAHEGGRLNYNFSWDPRIRLTVWNCLINGFVTSTGYLGLNQSCVQRIVSLPSLRKAKIALFIAGVGYTLIMITVCFIGIIIYARFHGCDPILSGLVGKADQLVAFFVQDVLGHLSGMAGVFISCVFSAAFSPMAGILNSLAGVVYFDYIKPFVKHTEARANIIMKVFVVLMGGYCIFGGYVVEKFGSIVDILAIIAGMNIGAVVGVFLIGMLVPRINGKVAVLSICITVITMMSIIVSAQIKHYTGVIIYAPLPTTTDLCEADSSLLIANLDSVPDTAMSSILSEDNITVVHPIDTSFASDREFNITEISYYWYTLFGALFFWLTAIPLSFVFKHNKEEKQNPKLFSPVIRKFLKKDVIEMEELPLRIDQHN